MRQEPIKGARPVPQLRIAGAGSTTKDGNRATARFPFVGAFQPGADLARLIAGWEAPILPDEEVELYAKLYLMRPGHELMPFFLWIDAVRASTR